MSRPFINNKRGEDHCATKVSDLGIEEIKRLRRAGVPVKKVAARFSISERTVTRLTNNNGRVTGPIKERP